MSNRAWMPFYVADYLADTLDLDNEQHGVYVTLLLIAWQRPTGGLPNDMGWMKKVLKGRFRDFHGHQFNRLVPPLLKRFFHLQSDGCWHQKRLDLELQKSDKISAKAKQNVNKRWSDYRKIKGLVDTDVILGRNTITKKVSKSFFLGEPQSAPEPPQVATEESRPKRPSEVTLSEFEERLKLKRGSK